MASPAISAARRRRRIARELARMAALFPRMGLDKVILFGSAARGDGDADSDIDLIVVKRTGKDSFERRSEVRETLNPRLDTDILVYTPREFDGLIRTRSFVRLAVGEGKVLYDSRKGRGKRAKVALPPSEVDPRAEARHWLAKAERDLTVAKDLARLGHHGHSCFYFQQAAEKVLKAYLHSRGVFGVRGHSIVALSGLAARTDSAFAVLGAKTAPLDEFYLRTRYPDGPEREYGLEDSQVAFRLSGEVLDFVRSRLEL